MSQGAYCHHDGFNGCQSMDEYRKKITGCGDSSTGLMIVDLNKEFPQSKIVIIKKSELELNRCIKWCDKTYGGDSRKSIFEANEKLLNIKGLVIDQSDINERLKEIWTYLIDKEWHDKYTRLIDFNIQSDPYNIDFGAALRLHESIQ